ncbi:DNA topoisomerase 2 [Allomyces arbusculus]|nr:DNA topoisomerase 2 [Allomyces arbusculus]
MSDSDFLASSDDDYGAPPPAPKAKARGKAAAAAAPAAAKPKPKRAPAKKKPAASAAADDMDVDSDSDHTAPPRPAAAASSSAARTGAGKTVEETYQRKSQIEHILLRPDTYIGTVEAVDAPMWVLNAANEFEYRSIHYVPGLFKIFDEILVNAADNKTRDPSMDSIKVTIDIETNLISVWNNGRGIPVQMHKEEKLYVPELIFGHLLTSSNYNDNDKKVTGGRNGYGAKLTNIFSTEFTVETADKDSGKKFKQVFSNNMGSRTPPVISDNKKGEEYTKISFKPDLAKFGMTSLDADIVALLKKRVYDMAGCVRGVKVWLNGDRIKIRDFKAYVQMYLKSQEGTLVYEVVNDRWEVAVAPSDEQFRHMSFVNSICTSKGGTHVNYVVDQVVSKLQEAVVKKAKTAKLTPFQVKNHLWVFVNCLIENPSFDSQTKENMTLRAAHFGSKCPLSDEFHKKVLKSGVLDKLLNAAAAKQDQLLKKTDGKKSSRVTGIVKLDDANNAGTRQASKCTLILTEGDSAKTIAVAGLAVVGRDNYGVFPLRGKLLNVRDAAGSTVSNNVEIQHLKKILGLQQGKVYKDASSLRYGHLMIMTDQDHDGSHIKGLIINFLDQFWPSLLQIPDFLCEFITPIVKCTKGTRELVFYTIPEYEQWRERTDTSSWKIKYYKGLGTSSREEAKKYFSNLDKHRKPFDPCTQEDRALIDMAFNKKKADERKQWLATFTPGTYMDHAQDSISIADFVNKELMLFSIADNHRSIPSVVDGLKPGQRKILYGCFKRKLKGEVKVFQLAGYISEHTAYHHGEQSLCATIIGMAQDFVGSNNVNVLEPCGQFGTRLQGGQDAASPRYIFTALPSVTRRLFHPQDDALLNYLEDDGQRIEPAWYLPVLPMVLVNGSQGIGTGWSTSIPNYNPLDVVENLRRIMRGESPEDMVPWYRGFKGTISRIGTDRFKVQGICTRTDDTTIEITELPIGTWTQTFKGMLEDYMTGDAPVIADYKEYHTDTAVHFVITLSPAWANADMDALDKKFKLTTTLATSNMVCFDEHGRIKKYASTTQILQDFYTLRLAYYGKRKEWLTAQLLKEYSRLENRVRFVTEVINRTLIIERKKKAQLCTELRQRKYLEIAKDGSLKEAQDDDENEVEDASTTGFDYLLSMPLYSLTFEKVEQLEVEMMKKKAELDYVLSQSPEDMWQTDLDAFVADWHADEERRVANETKGIRRGAGATAGKGKGKGKAAPAKRKAAAAVDASDDEFVATAPKRARAAPKKAAAVKVEDSEPAPASRARAAKTAAVMADPDDKWAMDVDGTPAAAPAATAAAAKKQSTMDDFFSAVTRNPPGLAAGPATPSTSSSPVPPTEPAKPKRGRPKKAAAVPEAAAPASAPAPAPKPAAKRPVVELDDDDDEDDLSARLKRLRESKKVGAAAPTLSSVGAQLISPHRATATAMTLSPSPIIGRPVPRAASKFSVASVESPAPKPKPRGRPRKSVVSDSDDGNGDDDDVVVAAPSRPAASSSSARPARRAAAAKPAPRQAVVLDSDDDDDGYVEPDDSGSDFE